jgi:WD40 repeat protein
MTLGSLRVISRLERLVSRTNALAATITPHVRTPEPTGILRKIQPMSHAEYEKFLTAKWIEGFKTTPNRANKLEALFFARFDPANILKQNRQIANEIGCAEPTIQKNLSEILGTFGIESHGQGHRGTWRILYDRFWDKKSGEYGQWRSARVENDANPSSIPDVTEPSRMQAARYHNTAPALPVNYVERPEALAELRRTLYHDSKEGRSIMITALQGMGGVGKTLLAQALAHDPLVQQEFPDGIIWIAMGKESARDIVMQLREIGKAFNDHLNAYDTELGSTNRYRACMRDKAALIVLDDVWDARDLEPFRANSPRSCLLFTTRDAALASSAGVHPFTVGFLTPEQSREMLARWSGCSINALPAEANDIIRECGGLALALSIIGAMLRGKPNSFWQCVSKLLRNADLRKIRQQFPNYQHPDLLSAIQISVDDLAPKTRERFHALAVLLEDMPIHPLVARVLWNVDETEASWTAEELVARALAQRVGNDGRSIRLHDLLLDYIRAQHPDHKAMSLIQDAVRLSSHIIERYPEQFAPQLVGRLLVYRDTERIRHFTETLTQAVPQPWLRPITSLQSPGTGLLRTLDGHRSTVNVMAVTPDGQRVVSASWDRTLKVWDLASGRIIATLEGHNRTVTAVAVTPDGHRAVSASWDKTLKVWDITSGRAVATLEGHADLVSAVALTPDGRHAVSASLDKTLKVWDLGSGRALATLEGHSDAVWTVALTPDGQRAISASWDKTLKVWDLDSGRILRTLEGHADTVSAAAITPDGRRAVSASWDKTLKVWDLASGRAVATLAGHTGLVSAVAVTPDGQRAVSASWDNTLKVWDLTSGRAVATLEGHADFIRAVAITPDGRRAVSASWDKTLKVWDIRNGRALATLEGHADVVFSVVVTPDGQQAVSTSWDGALKVWDITSGGAPATRKGHAKVITFVAVTPDGQWAISASRDKTLKVWEIACGRALATLEGHADTVSAVAVTPDGKHAVSASWDKTLKAWDLGSGRAVLTLEGHAKLVSAVAVTPDGKHAVSASWDKTLKVWDLGSGRVVVTFEGHADAVWAAAVMPDGMRAVSVSWDKTLKVWDLMSGRTLATLEGNGAAVMAAAITPDGQRAVTASRDATLTVWDLTSGRTLATLKGHADAVRAVALTPDGQRAVSASRDKTLKVWDLMSGRALATLEGHTKPAVAIAVMPDGQRAVSVSRDKTLKVWDLPSGCNTATFCCDDELVLCKVGINNTIVACDEGGRFHVVALEESLEEIKSSMQI